MGARASLSVSAISDTFCASASSLSALPRPPLSLRSKASARRESGTDKGGRHGRGEPEGAKRVNETWSLIPCLTSCLTFEQCVHGATADLPSQPGVLSRGARRQDPSRQPAQGGPDPLGDVRDRARGHRRGHDKGRARPTPLEALEDGLAPTRPFWEGPFCACLARFPPEGAQGL